MSGGGGTSTNTVTNSDPWPLQQPYILEGFDEAQKRYNKGIYETPVQFHQAAGLLDNIGTSGPYQTALQSAEGVANYQPDQRPLDVYDTIATNSWKNQSVVASLDGLGQWGGLNPTGQNALSSLAANGATNAQGRDILSALGSTGALDSQGFTTLQGMAGQGTYGSTLAAGTQGMLALGGTSDAQGMDYLRRTAAGDYLTQQNPYFQQVVDQSIASARPSVDAAFANSGRLGSGAQAAAFSDAAARIGAQMGYQDYTTERGYQNAAANALLAQGNSDAALRLQAAAGLDAGSRSDASMRQGVAQNLIAAGFQNAGVQQNAATGLLNAGYQDAATRQAASQGLLNSGLQDFSNRQSAWQAAGALQNQTDAQRIQAATNWNTAIQDAAGIRMQGASVLPSIFQIPGQAAVQSYGMVAPEYARVQNGGLSDYWNIVGNNPLGQATNSTGYQPGPDNTGTYVAAGVTAAASIAAAVI